MWQCTCFSLSFPGKTKQKRGIAGTKKGGGQESQNVQKSTLYHTSLSNLTLDQGLNMANSNQFRKCQHNPMLHVLEDSTGSKCHKQAVGCMCSYLRAVGAGAKVCTGLLMPHPYSTPASTSKFVPHIVEVRESGRNAEGRWGEPIFGWGGHNREGSSPGGGGMAWTTS